MTFFQRHKEITAVMLESCNVGTIITLCTTVNSNTGYHKAPKFSASRPLTHLEESLIMFGKVIPEKRIEFKIHMLMAINNSTTCY